jgi:hypothetical protein
MKQAMLIPSDKNQLPRVVEGATSALAKFSEINGGGVADEAYCGPKDEMRIVLVFGATVGKDLPTPQ